MVEFGGWEMPVQYSGIMDEHHAVRQAAGVFDISHMGQFTVHGPAAAAWLDGLLTNNIARLAPGTCQYTFLLNERGGIIDDLIVYQLGSDSFFLVVNAAKIDEDFAWMQARLDPGVTFQNESADHAGLAIQGPNAPGLFKKLFGENETFPPRNAIKPLAPATLPCALLLATTGYTGEEGFEIFFPAAFAAAIWRSILEAGASLGLQPCGLGARDTLRLEMCYPLNGSDLSHDRTPLEAGMSVFVDLEKGLFPGREALLAQRERGVPRRLVPFLMKEKSPPPRAHYCIFKNSQPVAEVASGTLSPSLGAGIGMAYLPAAIARAGEEIEIDIRGRRYPATVAGKPLLRKTG